MNEYKILDKAYEYTIVYTGEEMIKTVLRHGQHGREWRDVTRDNFIHALFWQVLKLERQLKEVKDGSTPTLDNSH